MDIKLVLGVVTTIISIYCFFPYFKDIFQKKTKPHMFTWLIWSVIQTIGVITQLKGGAGYGSWALGFSTIFVITIFILSIKNGTKNITDGDKLSLFFAFITLIIYLSTKNPILSIIFVALTDFLGYVPTFRKAYKDPSSETYSFYLLSFVCNFLSILALQKYSFVTMFYSIVLLMCNLTLTLIILSRRSVV